MKRVGKYVLTASLILNHISPLMVSASENIGEVEQDIPVLEEKSESQLPEEIEDIEIVDEVDESEQLNEKGNLPDVIFDITSVTVDPQEGMAGEEITFSFPIEAFESFSSGSLTIQSAESEEEKELPFQHNEENNSIEAVLAADENTEEGSWIVRSIELLDTNEEKYSFKNSLLFPEEESYDLSYLDFNIVTAPVVEYEKIEEVEVATVTEEKNEKPTVVYSTHVQGDGWLEEVYNGYLSGTINQSKRLEAIKIRLEDLPYEGGIEYETHVQSYGWLDAVSNGEMSGKEGKSKRLEAIRIRLTGEIAEHYDVYYRVHAQSHSWLGWAKNGENAGTEGLEKRLEAIQIELVEKGGSAPETSTKPPYIITNPIVSYSTHVEKDGWQSYVENGEMSGTEGRSLRLEGIKMNIFDPAYSGGVEYRTHVQSQGWQDWKANDGMSGTEGLGLRLEAIDIRLTGEIAKHYDIYYRVHAQSFGWLDWAKNGESAGTEGVAKRLEGIEVVVVKKGGKAPGNTTRPFILSNPKVNYTTHVQKEGWQATVSNGSISGTTGKGLRLEGILMNLHTQSLTGNIQHRTHVEKEGWQDWREGWNLSGTQGKGLRLEAIQIQLTEEMAKYYDVYYRVHAQSFGWLGWAKNGESAGTEGHAKRLEGIQVRLVLKGKPAPGSTNRPFVKK